MERLGSEQISCCNSFAVLEFGDCEQRSILIGNMGHTSGN